MTADWTATLAPRPPSRRYPFWARRDRRRAAQALAAGRPAQEVALVDRVPVMEVERLLRDDEFDELVRHYRTLSSLSYNERIARLSLVALEILELGLETGDMRVAMFVLAEQRAGRDPAQTIAARAVQRIEQAQTEKLEKPVRRAPAPSAPRPPAGDWDHCAATKQEPDEAEALAVSELRAVRSAQRRVLNRLADRLLSEAERMGTALGEVSHPALVLEAAARGVARHYHQRPVESLNAAERLQGLRRLGGFGHGAVERARGLVRGTGPPGEDIAAQTSGPGSIPNLLLTHPN